MLYLVSPGRVSCLSTEISFTTSISLCALIIFGMPRSVHGQCEDDELLPLAGQSDAQFGRAVDLDGDRIVIGASRDADGDSAYFFDLVGNTRKTWIESQLADRGES